MIAVDVVEGLQDHANQIDGQTVRARDSHERKAAASDEPPIGTPGVAVAPGVNPDVALGRGDDKRSIIVSAVEVTT